MTADKKRAGARSAAARQQDADRSRGAWMRKPATQIVPNKKAEQRRRACRKGTDDGAVIRYEGNCGYFGAS